MNEKKLIINIGRQFGSGGHQIAMALGRKLGITVYDNELIAKAAEESGFCKDLFVRSDENRSVFSVSSFFTSGRYEITTNYMSDNELFRIQSDVIRKIASEGSAIFVGRCSDYILRNEPCIDVFITSSLEVRRKRVAERAGITEAQAEALIIKKERTRETYYNYFTFGHWGVASNYDLCIDSSLTGIEETADLIIEFGKKRGLINE